MEFTVGFMVGALIGVWLISRILRKTVFQRLTGWRQIWVSLVTTLAISTLIGGVGFADGGPMRFGYAFSVYLLPVLAWLLVDRLSLRRRERAAAEA